MKIHMVKEGDTLYELSKKYAVPLQTLIDANPQITNPDVLMVGDKVKIPSSAVPVGNDENVIYKHVVKQGDTLWKLSKAWGVSLKSLIDANSQLKSPNALLAGEVVNIPGGGQEPEQSSEQAPQQASETAPESQTGTGTGGTVGSGKKNTAPKTPTEPVPVPVEPAPVEPIAETPAPAQPVPEQPAVPIPVAPAPEPPKNEIHYEFEFSELIMQQPTHFEYVNTIPQYTPAPPVQEKPCGCSDTKPAENSYMMPYQHMAPQAASYYDFPNMPMTNESPAYTSPANTAPNLGPINYMPSNISPADYAPNLAPVYYAPVNIAPAYAAPNAAPNLSPFQYMPNAVPSNLGPYSPFNNSAPNLSPSQISPMNAENNSMLPQLESYSGGYPGITNDPYNPYTGSMPNMVSPEMYAPNSNSFMPQPCGCGEGMPAGYPAQTFPAYAPEGNQGGWNIPSQLNYEAAPGTYQAPYWNMQQPQYPAGYPYGFNTQGFMPDAYSSYGNPYGFMVPGAPIGGTGVREENEYTSAEFAGAGSEEQSLNAQFQANRADTEKVKVSTQPAEKRTAKKQSRTPEKNAKARSTSNKAKSRRNPWIGN
ncbi:LysM peptidoglycan-binding domain-containing protein [Paenibacillus pinistramenti]|uniref:LysM peptidoglycan-binding domain-containing protein n=1 Tax=Paenibacillus pinistramenti TaxID=1768003 RepID=UPI001108A7E8|nr:LysM peptidoglycan-binding domain-containing protein [Paenibacillus pinistramenti]